MLCANCKAKCPDDAKYCPHCGRPVGLTNCPNCGAKLTAKYRYCPQCGEEAKTRLHVSSIKGESLGTQNSHSLESWFSWRRIGSILTLFWVALTLLLLSFGDTESSLLGWIFIIIRIWCGIAGLNAESKAPAVVLILTLITHMIFTLISISAGNYYSSYYNRMAGLPADYLLTSSDGVFILFLLYLIPAFMMLITPMKYRVENKYSKTKSTEPKDDNKNASGYNYVSGYTNPVVQETKQSNSGISQNTQEQKLEEDEWKCPYCGMINKNYFACCIKCLKEKPKV